MKEIRTNAIRVYLETFIDDERLTVRKQLNDLNADVKELTYRIDVLRDQLKTKDFGRLYGDIYFDHNVYDLEVELDQIIKVRDMVKENKMSLQDIVSTMTLEDVNEWKNVFEWYNSNFKISEYVVQESENLNIKVMTVQEIKEIKMGTILTWNPSGELFRVTGFNEFKVKDGTETKVSGIECDEDGRYCPESMPSLYDLSRSSFYR